MDASRVVFPGRLAALPVAALYAMALSSCGLHPRADTSSAPIPGDEIVITREQIAELGATTAWEVVKRRVPGLTYRENSAGQPTRIWRHGPGSLYLNETPLLFVDGVRVAEIQALGDIPAGQVESIRIKTGLGSSAEYGTNSASGVILVVTRSGT